MTEQILSEREREVLALVAEGATNQQIANELSISANTVKVHLRNIYSKMGVMSRTEATMEGLRLGLIRVAGVDQSAPAEQLVPSIAEASLVSTPQEPPAAEAATNGNGTPAPETQEDLALPQTPPLTPLVEQRAEQLLAALPADPCEDVPLLADTPVAAVPTVSKLPTGEASLAPTPRQDLAAPPHHPAWLLPAAVAGLLLIAVIGWWMMSDGTQPDATPTATTDQGPTSVLPSGWQLHTPLPEPRAGLGLIFYDGALYVLGGETSGGVTGTVWQHDIADGTWQQLAEKPTPVADAGAALIGGKIYMPGGRTNLGAPSDVLEIFDPRTNAWSSGAAMPAPRFGHAVAQIDGLLYVFGGRDGQGIQDTAWRYNPSGDAWEELPTMPDPLAYAGVVALASSNQLLIVGGERPTGPSDATHLFAPGSPGRWSSGSTMPRPVARPAVAAANAQVYVIGGEAQESVLLYMAPNDSWTDAPLQHGHPLERASAVFGDNIVFVVGGWDGTSLLAEHRFFTPIYRQYIPSTGP